MKKSAPPIELIIPEKPEPIITGFGFAYGIENKSGEVMVATTVLAKADPKNGGLNTDIADMAGTARGLAAHIVKFAECMDGEAVRVRYMDPDEYAKWCDENEDDDTDSPLDDEDEP